MTTIIIADDEEAILEMISLEFSQAGFNIIQAENGDQAFNKARAYEQICNRPVDFIISDIRMPVCTGYGLVKKLQNSGSTTPVILVTGFPGFDSEGVELKDIEVLNKPFKITILLEKVKQALKAA